MSTVRVATRIGTYALGGTIGSLFVAYGIWSTLFATSNAWYRAAAYQGSGILITFLGWVILVLAAINLYGDLNDT